MITAKMYDLHMAKFFRMWIKVCTGSRRDPQAIMLLTKSGDHEKIVAYLSPNEADELGRHLIASARNASPAAATSE